jgi:hypothetical protein
VTCTSNRVVASTKSRINFHSLILSSNPYLNVNMIG